MKKITIDYEADFWEGPIKHSCISLIDAFFKMDDLPTVKDTLNKQIIFSAKHKVLTKDNPSLIFHYYLCMRSFIRACYELQLRTRQFRLKDPPEYTSKLLQGSLTDEEYANPFLVFKKAFKKFTLKEFEYYHTQLTYFSLSHYADDPEPKITHLFIYLQKMLDAGQIICERGIEKIKR